MKKVVYNQFGDFDQLCMIDTPMPAASDDQLIIKVHAVGLNPLDWKLMAGEMKFVTGKKFPKGLAYDFSGVVEHIGANVDGYQKGDAIFGAFNNPMKEAALAEYVVASKNNLQKMPKDLSFEEAAALPSAGISALKLLKRAHLGKGEELLINGAAGGIGYFLTQIAVQQGLKVTAVARSTGLKKIQKFDVSATVDYKQTNILHQKKLYDAVIDLSGKLSFPVVKKILKPSGYFVHTIPSIKSALWFTQRLFSRQKYSVIFVRPKATEIAEVAKIANRLDIALTSFPFDEYKLAYKTAKKGGLVGKVVISLP